MFAERVTSERRPWGHFTTVLSTHKVTTKILVVKPMGSLSLQYHNKRDEFWVWLDGAQPRMTLGDVTFWMESAVRYTVPRGTKHRIHNPDPFKVSSILEVSLGRFDEDDIVRLDDKYGRV